MRIVVFNKQDKPYETIALGVEYQYKYGYISKIYFYFINENKKLERANEYVPHTKYLHTRIFVKNIRAVDKLSWCKTKFFNGYDFFYRNKKAIKQLKNGRAVNREFERKCFKLTEDNLLLYKKYDNQDIKSKEDIKDLLEFTGGFHDAHVEKIIKDKKNNKLTLEFTGIWGFKRFYLDFSGHISSRLFEDDLKEFWFNEAGLFFDKDKQICFLSEEGSKSKKELEKNLIDYVYADKLSFRYIFDKPFQRAKNDKNIKEN